MGRYFKEKGGKYREYSTVTEEPVGKWISANEMRAVLAMDKIYKACEQAIHHELKFPGGRGFQINGGREKYDEYEELPNFEYYHQLFEEFNNRMKATGVEWVLTITVQPNDQAKKEAGED